MRSGVDESPAAAQARMEQVLQLATEREARRRASDPYAHVRARKPPAPTATGGSATNMAIAAGEGGAPGPGGSSPAAAADPADRPERAAPPARRSRRSRRSAPTARAGAAPQGPGPRAPFTEVAGRPATSTNSCAPAPAGGAAPQEGAGRRRGGNKPADGEVGKRLGRKIDRLLAELQGQGDQGHAGDPRPAAGAAAPSEPLRIQLGRGLTLLADRPAPADAPAPPLPVVLTDHTKPAQPQAGSCWSTIAAAMPSQAAELEAMAQLQRQLAALPQGSTEQVCLPAPLAQALILRLLR